VIISCKRCKIEMLIQATNSKWYSTYLTVATVMTFSVLESHFPIARLFMCNSSYLWCGSSASAELLVKRWCKMQRGHPTCESIFLWNHEGWKHLLMQYSKNTWYSSTEKRSKCCPVLFMWLPGVNSPPPHNTLVNMLCVIISYQSRLSDSHTDTHNHFTTSWILSGTTQVSRHQKGKTRKVKPLWIYWSKR